MRRFVVLLLALGAVVGMPLSASAHDVLESTNPADRATVERVPAAVVLTFSEDPLPLGTQLLVRGPGGDVAEGKPTVSGREVRQAVSSSAPGGDYTVTYRVTSDDGHPVSGTFAFRATTGLDGSAAPAATGPVGGSASAAQPDGGGSSLPVVVGLAVVLVVVLVAVGLLLRRRRPTSA
jgi:methionine-rich copper-binding protein CopC